MLTSPLLLPRSVLETLAHPEIERRRTLTSNDAFLFFLLPFRTSASALEGTQEGLLPTYLGCQSTVLNGTRSPRRDGDVGDDEGGGDATEDEEVYIDVEPFASDDETLPQSL